MSRVAKKQIKLPNGVKLSIMEEGNALIVFAEGKLGKGRVAVNSLVEVTEDASEVWVKPKNVSKDAVAQAGTQRSLIANLVIGVSQGFTRTLQLVGVGYRAQVKGSEITLSLGFSHPVVFKLPDEISAETPSQTEIVLKGSDKQLLGQTAANIRALRKPEPYKGKGVRYSDEFVKRKEAKKK